MQRHGEASPIAGVPLDMLSVFAERGCMPKSVKASRSHLSFGYYLCSRSSQFLSTKVMVSWLTRSCYNMVGI